MKYYYYCLLPVLLLHQFALAQSPLDASRLSAPITLDGVLDENTYIGGIFTNRIDLKGNYNTAWGVDGIIRAFGDEYITARWAQSFENGKPNALLSLDPARIYLNWERRRYDGFSYNISFSKAGKDYVPDMGFELKSDILSCQPNNTNFLFVTNESQLIIKRTAYDLPAKPHPLPKQSLHQRTVDESRKRQNLLH